MGFSPVRRTVTDTASDPGTGGTDHGTLANPRSRTPLTTGITAAGAQVSRPGRLQGIGRTAAQSSSSSGASPTPHALFDRFSAEYVSSMGYDFVEDEVAEEEVRLLVSVLQSAGGPR